MIPLVSVVTPTWRRHEMLLGRCIPSVQAQTYPAVEHIVVSDGGDGTLQDQLTWPHKTGWWNLLYKEMDYHVETDNFGHWARVLGLEYSAGEYITYCDDDDALRPEHCQLMVDALEKNPNAGFAVSRMVSHHAHPVVIGWGPLACGNVGSPMIMHRRSTLEQGTWKRPSWVEDWELIEQWLNAGVKYVNVDAETADVYPSVFR
jgi:glycosyltransferase involved in cell wall biosynthesis